MKSYRLLIILLAGIVAVVAAAFVLTIVDSDHEETAPVGPERPTATVAATSSSPTPLPPGADVFGNRLETTNSEAGTALPQDAGTRPAWQRPDYGSSVPARMQWQRGWGGAALPVSGSDGPERIDSGIAAGFARTPQGAALAALDALARALAAPDGVWQRVVRERYYGDHAGLLDRFTRARARTRTPNVGRYVVVPDGIRVAPGFADDFAVVQIATRADLGYTMASWPMAWIDGDWRVRVDNPESLWGPGQTVMTLDGFGIWRAGA
ncbi:hypothetical protein [Nocardia sp. NPDC057227]|uniref:hypothetical protein n=1 Tax=Nocardia sp. NPDC057227 TaxID=3346056 RepID=UPI0036285400